MIIIVNGKRYVTEQTNLADLLKEACYDGMTVATAVDQHFIARDKRADTRIKEGAHVEIVAPMQGG